MSAESEVTRAGELVTQFSVMLQNRVGSLASLVKLLRANMIEVVGMSMQDSRDATVARLIVTDPDGASQLFIEKGIPHTTSGLLVVSLQESGAGLLRVLEALLAAETNVDFAYALMPQLSDGAMLALHVEDPDFAWSVLNQAGFRLLCQDDLSR